MADVCLGETEIGVCWAQGHMLILSNGWTVKYFPIDAGPLWVVSTYSFSWNPVLPASKPRNSGLLFCLVSIKPAMTAMWPGPRMCGQAALGPILMSMGQQWGDGSAGEGIGY